MASPKVDLKSVEDFWSVEACGTHFVTEFDGLRDFYDKYRPGSRGRRNTSSLV